MMIDENNSDLTKVFVCANLKRLRETNNLSNSDIAIIIGKSRQGYINYETGTREIGIQDLVTLSNYYNISLDELVGNPFLLRKLSKLEFRSYEYIDGQLEIVSPIIISAMNNDIVVVKQNEYQLDFFWKTQLYHKNRVMLFDYFDKPYSSKLYFNSDNSGFFLLKDEHISFNKAQSESIIIKGVCVSTISKDFHVEHFF
jgi:transcriptional regulator with XRE-family HTH domain